MFCLLLSLCLLQGSVYSSPWFRGGTDWGATRYTDFWYQTGRFNWGSPRWGRGYFTATPTTPTTPTTSFTQWPWFENWFDKEGMIHLDLYPDQTGAWPVLKDVDKSNVLILKPVCDDLFTDKAATVLCQISRLGKFGRRTSVVTEEEFVLTSMSCYDSVYYDEDTEMMLATEDCNAVEYTAAEALPCAKNQAAAVYCYDEELFTQKLVVGYRVTEKSWSVDLQFGVVKLGKLYNVLDKDSLGLMEPPKKNDFEVVECGKPVKITKIKMKTKANAGIYTLQGTFDKDCTAECTEIFHDGEYLESVCVQDW